MEREYRIIHRHGEEILEGWQVWRGKTGASKSMERKYWRVDTINPPVDSPLPPHTCQLAGMRRE